MDPVKILPTEVIEKVLSYLNLDDLMACCLVSQKWNIAANNEVLWKEFCTANGWNDCGSLKKHLNCFNFLNTDSFKDAFNNLGEWKKHFIVKSQLQKNWRIGNSVDYVFHPMKSVDECDIGTISSVSSDGHNLLAFGFSKGLLLLFNLKNNSTNLLFKKHCPLIESVDYIEIINDYLVLVQQNLLQIYKFVDGNLDLYRAKLIDINSVTEVDLDTLMQLDSKSRTELIRESRENIDDNIIFHFTDCYLAVTTLFSHKIYVYNMNNDFIQPIVFDIEDMEINVTDKFIFNIHCRNDILYILLSVSNYSLSAQEDVFDTSKFSIHAFSLKSKTLLFSHNVVNNRFIYESNVCTIETNDRYLVLRFDMNFFFIYDRANGKLLISDRGMIFLNANSNPSLIGICLDISFQITDPATEDCYFCLTLEGSPVSMFSNVLITSCVEFDRDGNGSSEIEFWNMYRTVQKIGTLEFPNNPNVILIYKDDTKVIFYAEKDHVVVRSFLV